MAPRGTASATRRTWGNALLDLIERRSTSGLFAAWLAMILMSGVFFWLAQLLHASGLLPNYGLVEEGRPVGGGLMGLATAVYFSFVTATSVGYGDVVPVGLARMVAIAESVAALLIFGAVVAKFVSRKQDELVREIYQVTFEERLDRVQMYLHLVISDLQSLAMMCAEESPPVARISVRFESAVIVFSGELRAVHDLLYHPQHSPPEAILASILAGLTAAMRTLAEVMDCLPSGFRRSPTLQETLISISRLADEICADCVPQDYAPALRTWMDHVHDLARQIR